MYNFFVSIASYKDPELRFTIDSVLLNARRPEIVRIVVCQQDHPDRFITYNHPNVELLNFNYVDSQGVCWARNQICKRYLDEPYFLQLDSHMALVKNWDDIILEQISVVKSKGHAKVIFAAYPTTYTLKNGERTFYNPYNPRTVLREDNVFKFHTGTGGDNNFNEPIPSPYLNAGFMFGDGTFYVDCGYDPEIYFEGEELLNTVKAFTHGYDLFNPSIHISWHLYKDWSASKEDRDSWPLHYKEEDDRLREIRHWERHNKSKNKLIEIFSGMRPEKLGTIRTIQDYESYIGRAILKNKNDNC